MNQIKVSLDIIENISKFVNATSNVKEDIFVRSNACEANGKSIMGIYSLNLSKPITVRIDAKEFPKSFLNSIKDIII